MRVLLPLYENHYDESAKERRVSSRHWNQFTGTLTLMLENDRLQAARRAQSFWPFHHKPLAGMIIEAAATLLIYLLHRVTFGLDINFHATTQLLFTDGGQEFGSRDLDLLSRGFAFERIRKGVFLKLFKDGPRTLYCSIRSQLMFSHYLILFALMFVTYSATSVARQSHIERVRRRV